MARWPRKSSGPGGAGTPSSWRRVGEILRKRTSVIAVANTGWSVPGHRSIATSSARRGKVSGRPPGPRRSSVLHSSIFSTRPDESTMATASRTTASSRRSTLPRRRGAVGPRRGSRRRAGERHGHDWPASLSCRKATSASSGGKKARYLVSWAVVTPEARWRAARWVPAARWVTIQVIRVRWMQHRDYSRSEHRLMKDTTSARVIRVRSGRKNARSPDSRAISGHLEHRSGPGAEHRHRPGLLPDHVDQDQAVLLPHIGAHQARHLLARRARTQPDGQQRLGVPAHV